MAHVYGRDNMYELISEQMKTQASHLTEQHANIYGALRLIKCHEMSNTTKQATFLQNKITSQNVFTSERRCEIFVSHPISLHAIFPHPFKSQTL